MQQYKCIKNYFVGDTLIMASGETVTFEGNKLYNITGGVKYDNISIDQLKSYLQPVQSSQKQTIKTDPELFKDITDNMLSIFKKKNHDYGNSFEISLDEEGLAASRIRIGDKWNRFKSLSKGAKAQVNDESLKDTLLDMANYAIMTVMWMDKNGNV